MSAAPNMGGMGSDPQADLRKLWRSHWADPTRPPFPDVLRGLTCGAKTRAGTPCKRVDLERNARCKLHGGRSTGPRTTAGIERARQNLALRWQRSEPHEGLIKADVGEFSVAAREPDLSFLKSAREPAAAIVSNVASPEGMCVTHAPPGPVLNTQPTLNALPSQARSAIEAIAQRRRERSR